MRVIAYILAIICAIVAVMYFAIPAGNLPDFMPGASNSTNLSEKRASG